MVRLRIQTPSRLHFGLLSWGQDQARQFGGVGLMVDRPGLELIGEPAESWQAEGPLASRVLQIAQGLEARLQQAGTPLRPARLRVLHAPDEHVGLGVGTQLSLAVTRLLLELRGTAEPSTLRLAELCGRGQRSGIGIHGFARGGLIVDGGRGASGSPPPLLAHHEFPAEWSVLVLLSDKMIGLHGHAEVQAFSALPPIPEAVTDRLCGLVLLGLLPALVERDLPAFGAALSEIQQQVGACFAPAQGGVFARPELNAIVGELQAHGLHGVGQSSWGPTLYGVSDEPADRREAIASRLRDRFGVGPHDLFWTSANKTGAVLGPVLG